MCSVHYAKGYKYLRAFVRVSGKKKRGSHMPRRNASEASFGDAVILDDVVK